LADAVPFTDADLADLCAWCVASPCTAVDAAVDIDEESEDALFDPVADRLDEYALYARYF
jgi:hypothetical protein